MITTVTLNPCIDKTIVINRLVKGGLNRIISSREDFGGKGINVSTALKNFKEDTFIIGIDFVENNFALTKMIYEKKIPNELIKVRGRLRVNTKIFEEFTKDMTEFNEIGTHICKEAVNKIKDCVKERAKYSDILVLSGSASPGFDDDIYKVLIRDARKSNSRIKIILDSSGQKLLEGLKEKPNIIKPNLHELEKTFNTRIRNQKEIVKISKCIISQGIEIVCVSLGRDGAIIVSKNEAYLALTPNLKVKSAQGAGDSLVAGLCYGLKRGASLKELLKYGISAASSKVILEGTQMGKYEDFIKFTSKIEIEEI